MDPGDVELQQATLKKQGGGGDKTRENLPARSGSYTPSLWPKSLLMSCLAKNRDNLSRAEMECHINI
jgi:hypothetical protein